VRGAGDLGRFLGGREWGVEDEDLFAATADLIAADTVPTLTVILTTSNHPPYSIDVTARGYKPHPDLADADPRILGHYWYADRALGAFAERLRPIPGLFLAVTGDHYGRQFVHDRPTIAERTAVPLVLWGSGLDPDLRFAPDAAGSHLDLVPTLVERCAPTGFIYQALGRDLLAPGATVGLGRDIAVTAQKFMQATLSPYAERNRYLTAVGWWRLTRDSAWPTVNDLPKQDGPE
jgi:phosphoglycerol transferase MdoB-like AlkP superfamily enzyme